jgi:hypothetical protein
MFFLLFEEHFLIFIIVDNRKRLFPDMKYLLTLISPIYLIQLMIIRQSYEEITLKKPATLDCSLYVNDYDILNSFPFDVDLILPNERSRKTFAYGERENEINALVIINETVLPRSFFCLKHLNLFYLISSTIIPVISDNDDHYKFPYQIENFAASLTSAHIENTKVIQLPEEFTKLKRLSSFEMSNTGLISLPDSIGNLTSLQFLRLYNNKLLSLPKSINNLELLRIIILDANPHLRSLESLNGIPKLRDIHAANCLIDRLPYNIPNLEGLVMINNSLTNLHGIETLGFNTSANKRFYFPFNHINSIPPEIRFVRNLTELALSHNQLTFLPTEIFHIDTLIMLDISNNLFNNKELNTIIKTFKQTNPNLNLFY